MTSPKFFLLLSILLIPPFSYGGDESKDKYTGLLRFDSCHLHDRSPAYKAYESLSTELIYSFIKNLQNREEDNSAEAAETTSPDEFQNREEDNPEEGMRDVFSRVFINGQETGWFEMPPVRKKYENNMTIKSPYITFSGHIPSSVRDQFAKSDINRTAIKTLKSETVSAELNLAFGYSKVIGVYGEFEKEDFEKIQFTALYPVSPECVITKGITIIFEEKSS